MFVPILAVIGALSLVSSTVQIVYDMGYTKALKDNKKNEDKETKDVHSDTHSE